MESKDPTPKKDNKETESLLANSVNVNASGGNLARYGS